MGKARWFFVVLFCFFVSHLNAQSSDSLTPAYSPWAKWYLDYPKGTTTYYTGRSAGNICGIIVSLSVRKRDHEQTAVLSVSLPVRAAAGQKFQIVLDQDAPIERPIKDCHVFSCNAEFEFDADELIERLSAGPTISVRGSDSAGQPVVADVPLAGFTEAYAGPGKSMPGIVMMPPLTKNEREEKKRKSDLETRAREERRMLAGCYGPWSVH